MPSDPRVERSLRALSDPVERYRSAVASAAEEVRGYLARHRSASAGSSEELAAELGPFAEGRIDLRTWSTLFTSAPVVDPATLRALEGAAEILRRAAARRAESFGLEVAAESRLRDAVAAALEEAGHVFSAARLVAQVKAGRCPPAAGDGRVPGPLSFERWSEAERRWAPPLVLAVDGAAVRAGDLVEFLDSGVKIVLVVRGACAPAPLARLITPGTLVVQTADETGLDRVARAEGPAVAAWVPEGAARFVHDPTAGPEPWDRIELWQVPESEPTRPIGGVSVRQQLEDLKHLLALARKPVGAPAAEGEAAVAAAPAAPAEGDPVDRLAAWLLSQADLSELG